MRTIRTKVYQFSELSEQAKETAIKNSYDLNVDYGWWESVYEDAENIGLKITGFDIDRGSYCKGDFITSAGEVVEDILSTHGESCETYKTALKYKNCFQNTSDEVDNIEELENDEDEFLKELLEDYRIILQKEYEYQTSEEAIIGTIEANEYEFTQDGKMF